jgi:hypothetical protein
MNVLSSLQFLSSNKNDCIQTFLQGLKPTESTDYSLWKATKKIKQLKKPLPLRKLQGTWEISNVEKAHAFAEHLANVFQPHPSENYPKRQKHLNNFSRPPINSNHQLSFSKEFKFKKSSTA